MIATITQRNREALHKGAFSLVQGWMGGGRKVTIAICNVCTVFVHPFVATSYC